MKRSCFAKIYADFSDNNKVYNMLLLATNAAGMSVLQASKHEFYPQGLTAALLLAESHVTIHTYPEDNMAYVDCFSCGEVTPEEVIFKFASMVDGSVICHEKNDRD
jgi:S-adenosylmethionine decarboxylase